jgi:pilus assembly protein TadC
VAGRKKENPYETQAKVSLVLAVIGGLSALALVAFVFRRFDWGEFAAIYLAGSLRYYAILGAAAVAFITGVIGFFVALNSAGQKRNSLSNLAWATFFLHSAILLVTLCVFVVFWFAREPIYPTN